MKIRSTRLSVEVLDERSLPSTVAYADFNKDGLLDMAAVTDSLTITVSLANPNGSYTVSDILRAPKGLPINGIDVGDYNGDGNLDVRTGGMTNSRFYSHTWLGNGDGTFSNVETLKSGRIRDGW